MSGAKSIEMTLRKTNTTTAAMPIIKKSPPKKVSEFAPMWERKVSSSLMTKSAH
jgi:hypothetical protein